MMERLLLIILLAFLFYLSFAPLPEMDWAELASETLNDDGLDEDLEDNSDTQVVSLGAFGDEVVQNFGCF